MSELKQCPFCGGEAQVNTWTMHGITESRCFCPNSDCPNSVRTVALEQWNSRPIEDALNARIAELEAEQRWIPVSEPPKECEMRVFKDGDAWCFVLPDFQDLQVSPSVWMKKGVLDKIYKELRSVRDE